MRKKVDEVLNSEYHWNGMLITLHRLCSSEMKLLAEIFHKTPLPPRMLHGNTRLEMERSLVADVNVDGEHVYIMYSAYEPMKNVLKGLGDSGAPTNITFKVSYNGVGYFWLHPTAKIIAKALKAKTRPSVYALLHRDPQNDEQD